MSQERGFDAAPMKVAYLFPGQGSQYVGMGKELYDSSPAARAVFQEVDDTLGVSLSKTMFEGPQEELTRTVNAQPAIMAVSIACLKAMQEAMGLAGIPDVDFTAGHSLGEYTCLVASGVLTLPEATLLVRERGRLMQQASEQMPGGMAVIIGLDELTIEEVCSETGTKISNINADDQIVIGGEHTALTRAMDLALLRGAKRLIRLQVSGAFHTSLMKPAAPGMAEALSQVSFNDSQIPIIGNCSALPLISAAPIKAELLDQLCGCVQWRRSVSYMLDSGVNKFYEIGPGRTLTGLVKKASESAHLVNVNTLAAINELAASA